MYVFMDGTMFRGVENSFSGYNGVEDDILIQISTDGADAFKSNSY